MANKDLRIGAVLIHDKGYLSEIKFNSVVIIQNIDISSGVTTIVNNSGDNILFLTKNIEDFFSLPIKMDGVLCYEKKHTCNIEDISCNICDSRLARCKNCGRVESYYKLKSDLCEDCYEKWLKLD